MQGCLGDLAEALIIAKENMADSWKYNREQINACARAGDLKPGDSIVFKAHEKLIFTSGLDPQYEVIRTCGPFCWFKHQ